MDNPAGESEMWLIEATEPGEETKVIGHHGVMPFKARLNGEEFLVGKTENTMVLDEYRSRILYPRFERRFKAEYEQRFAALFSTTGPAPALRLRASLGYQEKPSTRFEWWGRGLSGVIGGVKMAVDRRLRPEALDGFLGSPPRSVDTRSWRVTPVDHEAFMNQWQEFDVLSRSGQTGFQLIRDDSVMKWRYADHPSGVYRGVFGEDFCAVVHVRRRGSLYVSEFRCGSGAERSSWEKLTKFGRSSGCGIVVCVRDGSDPFVMPELASLGYRLLKVVPNEANQPDNKMPVWINSEQPMAILSPLECQIGPLVFEGPGR